MDEGMDSSGANAMESISDCMVLNGVSGETMAAGGFVMACDCHGYEFPIPGFVGKCNSMGMKPWVKDF